MASLPEDTLQYAATFLSLGNCGEPNVTWVILPAMLCPSLYQFPPFWRMLFITLDGYNIKSFL